MKILLTGANSFFGKNLINYCSTNDKVKLFCISRKKINKKNVKTVKINLSKKLVNKKFIDEKIDYVIHAAFVKMSQKLPPIDLIKINLKISENLIKILQNLKFKKIINLSSSSLYPNISGKFFETSPIDFLNNSDYPYAYSKMFTERMINLNFDKNKVITLRIGQIIGNYKDKTIISKMYKRLKKKNLIEIYGNGNRLINVIHVKKLIEYIFLILKKNLQGVYNISDYTISLKQLAYFLKLKYGNNKTKIIYKYKSIKNPRFVLDCSKIFRKIKKFKQKNINIINEI